MICGLIVLALCAPTQGFNELHYFKEPDRIQLFYDDYDVTLIMDDNVYIRSRNPKRICYSENQCVLVLGSCEQSEDISSCRFLFGREMDTVEQVEFVIESKSESLPEEWFLGFSVVGPHRKYEIEFEDMLLQ